MWGLCLFRWHRWERKRYEHRRLQNTYIGEQILVYTVVGAWDIERARGFKVSLHKQWANNAAAAQIQYTETCRWRDKNLDSVILFYSPPTVLQSVYLPTSLSASVTQCVCLESRCLSRQGSIPEKTKGQRSVNISAMTLKDHVQLDTSWPADTKGGVKKKKKGANKYLLVCLSTTMYPCATVRMVSCEKLFFISVCSLLCDQCPFSAESL